MHSCLIQHRYRKAQLELKGAEYDKKSKEVEKAQLENSIENATVVSDTTGIVKSINESGETNMYTGETQAFMTILATGSYRVKAKINEQNIGEVQEGMPAVVNSRIDENQVWQGTFSAIDRDEPVSGGNEMYYGMAMGSEEMSTSSSYYFYVNLESSDGLMLGQHVYIKKADTGEEKKGLWISEGYLSDLENKPYVWAEKNGKLEKREVELGEYDEMMMEYQITGGLENSDYIAFPQEFLQEGMKTTHEDIAMTGGDIMEEGMEGDEIMAE